MKKIVTLFFCFVIPMVSYGACKSGTYTNNDGSLIAKDQMIYVEETTGYKCGGNDGCSNGDVIYITFPHKIGNGFGILEEVLEHRFYKCEIGKGLFNDDKWVWQKGRILNICPSNKKGYDLIETDGDRNRFAKQVGRHGFTDVCYKPVEKWCDIPCNRAYNLDFFYCKDGNRSIMRCDDGVWTTYSNISYCYADKVKLLDGYKVKGIEHALVYFKGNVEIVSFVGKGVKIGSDISNSYVCWLCEAGYERNGDKCVEKSTLKAVSQTTQSKTEVKKESKAKQKTNFCDKFKGHDKRYACCVAGQQTKWSDENDLDNGECICVNSKTKEHDSSKEWNGQKCVAKIDECEKLYGNNKQAVTCCKTDNASWNSENEQCECSDENTEWKYEAESDVGQCKDLPVVTNTDQNDVKEDANQEIKSEIKSDGPSPEQISKAQEIISNFKERAKKEASVWKTAEGNFNGTRLASDITAGVVLGTVGGVVTGNVVKKNQIKKGFEALHCNVGGQKVADWGDEFTIGLQK